MKIFKLTFSLLFISLIGHAQIADTLLAKKITINGFCLCQATLSGLKQSYTDLKEVNVEEMDLAKGCFGQDSRYVAGKGYASDKQPGMIFQKDQDTDYISKIRLTKQFKGNLPDGKYIDLSTLKLKDLLKLYPALKDKWGSRGCSNYWNFSNDTLSFYVKIDTNKKPQFPINETYYMDKPIEGVDLVFSCFRIKHTTQTIVAESLKTEPIFFMDSVRVSQDDLSQYNPSDIALITVIKNISTIQKIFPGTKNGLIYIETKQFAKHRYWTYFKSKSLEYAGIVNSSKTDTTNVQYILNGKVLKKNFEGALALINDETFKGLIIINKSHLADEYGITDKDYGIVITTTPRLKKSK